MPLIPSRHEFEPNSNALNLWLYTRKNKESAAMVTRPGLFFTRDFPTDQVWFMVAVFLELIGVSLLVYGGATKGSTQFTILAVTVAIALFFADILLAYMLHRNEGEKCKARNSLLVEKEPTKKAQQEDILKRGRVGNFLIITLMILIALFKLTGIVFLGSSLDHPGIILALMIMFAIIVFVHVRHTGFYLYEKFTERAFKKQFKAYNYGTTDAAGLRIGQAMERNSQFSYSSGDLLGKGREELTGNNGSVIKSLGANDDGTYQYEITTQGILIDEDVSAFLTKKGLNNDQIAKIASACLQHQLFTLAQNN